MVRHDTGGLFAVNHLPSRALYTIRVESKVKLFDSEQAERVSRELELMRMTGLHAHLPMLPAMLCTFASPLALFSLFKVRASCELSHITEHASLSIDAIRYAGACVVAALERLHCHMGVVYRNLSPDALLVDEHGCVCLIDFRQAKGLVGTTKTFTLCGVADYLAPEQVTCSGHGMPADLWGLGILLWELSAGEGPWGNDPNEVNIYRRITDHTSGAMADRLKAERSRGFLPPDTFVPTLVDLIDSLLAPDPESRLGAPVDDGNDSATTGFEHLKEHSWFSSVRWDQLVEGLVHSPLLSTAATHLREQLDIHADRSSDAVVGELVGTTEFSGEGSWFAQY